ncbi:hypothetical protein DL96DRAFT_15688 [Flagelloscypha sp. PMI_526]|nr:hypothetical protein DL96DRAFT_15688 [Flagelloscypha sp. PMI_526]
MDSQRSSLLIPPSDPTPSLNFFYADGDVALRSSDNYLFRLHHRNLDVNAGGFPPIFATPASENDIPVLAEGSSTLELLFAFMYPGPHPDVDDLPFSAVDALAEAAEKYQVWPAMNVCRYRMRDFCLTHTSSVLTYACRNNLPKLIEACSSAGLQKSLPDMVSLLPPYLVVPWMSYRQQFITAWKLSSSETFISTSNTSGPGHCSQWSRPAALILKASLDRIVLPSNFDQIFNEGLTRSTSCCRNAIEDWKKEYRKKIDNALPLTSFI